VPLNPTLRRLAPASLVLLASLPAAAQTAQLSEDFKLTAPIPVEEAQFGYSVGVSGTTAIVGAPETFFTGNTQTFGFGAAYLIDTATGTRLAQIFSDDAAIFDEFGASVAISGTTAIVGAPGANISPFIFGVDAGVAYLFDASAGTQTGRLTPSDGSDDDRFGRSVAISGTTAIVGSATDEAGFFSGSAYLFDISDPSNPVEIAKLTAPIPAAFDDFGVSVATSDTVAIVGVPGDDQEGSDAGAAYLFDTATGAQIARLTANDAGASHAFGASVAISGDNVLVRAAGDGSVYLFDISDPFSPTQIAKLTASGASTGEAFSSVAIAGTTAMLGASDNAGAGSVYLFDISQPSNPVETAKLIASDGAPGDLFGFSVALSGTTAIVGAFADDDAGIWTGSAYLFSTERSIADLNNDGTLDFFDISIFLTAFNNQDPLADFNGDGLFDFFDVAAFIIAFGRG
jgi:hypothetical protein